MKRAEHRVAEADRLREKYNQTTRGAKGHTSPAPELTPEVLYGSTGDPLAHSEPELAFASYGILGSSRPNVALRRAEAEIYGDACTSVTDLARNLQSRSRKKSALRAAQEAVVIAAENGLWLGLHAPVSFDEAVDTIRREVRKGKINPLVGHTGRTLFVVPSHDLKLPIPEQAGTILPPEGQAVPDTLYWRRRVADGDVTVEPIQEKKDQL